MSNPDSPTAFLPLSVPVFQILVSLGDRDLHGYALIQDILQRTNGEVHLTASTLYGAVHRLLDAELIREVERPDPPTGDDDSRRRYYRLTDFGRVVVREESARLVRMVRQARAKHLAPEVEGHGS